MVASLAEGKCEMKLRRAFALLSGVALLGSLAKLNEMPGARASLLDNSAAAGQWLLSAAVAAYKGMAGNPSQLGGRLSVAVPGIDGGQTGQQGLVGAQAERPSGNPLWGVPVARLANTRERPIFSPSRRPPAPAPAYVPPVTVQQPAIPPDPERPTMSLVGTIIGASSVRLGVFIDSTTQSIVRLRLGEEHNGWSVRLISPREAILVKDGQPAAALELPPPGGASSGRRSGRDAVLNTVWKIGAD